MKFTLIKQSRFSHYNPKRTRLAFSNFRKINSTEQINCVEGEGNSVPTAQDCFVKEVFCFGGPGDSLLIR